jgi:hypothetical protein
MMIDKRDELIEIQKDIIARLEKLVALQLEKEKVMQSMIDNLSAQLSLIHWLNDIK